MKTYVYVCIFMKARNGKRKIVNVKYLEQRNRGT